jgi:transposase
MRERGIYPIFWPPFSPDLNPVETVWNKMKDWIAKYYPEMMSYDELRVVVKAVWDAFPAEELEALIRELPEHCRIVIDKEGIFHTNRLMGAILA